MHGTKQQTCRPYEMPLTRSNFDLNFSFPFCIYLDRKITILFLLFLPPPPPFSSLFSYHVITVNYGRDDDDSTTRLRIYVCFVQIVQLPRDGKKKNCVRKGRLYETYPYKSARRWPCRVLEKSTYIIFFLIIAILYYIFSKSNDQFD